MRSLWFSPVLRSAIIYGAAGLGFAGANLVLARMLPTAEYGLFTLVIALINLGHSLGTAGIDGVVLRRHLDAGPKLFQRSVAGAAVVGSALTIVVGMAYHLTTPMLLVVFVSTATGGIMMVAAARFQSEQRFGISLGLTQSPNLVLILAALAVVLSNGKAAWLPLFIAAMGFVLAAVTGWWVLFARPKSEPAHEHRFPWREAISFAGLNAAGLLLLQLDRLIIPHVLSVHELATYGVLAAIAGSLFRILSMGVGYTLVPRLREAPGILQRRALIAHEAKVVTAIVAAGAAVIWFVTPLLEQWFLGGKYHLGGSLVLAVLITGVIKLTNSFSKAVVSALATPGELSLMNLMGWVSVAVAIPAAVIGARWGLAGVIYGVGTGWLVRAFTASYLAFRHLKSPAVIAATSPPPVGHESFPGQPKAASGGEAPHPT